MFFNLFFCFIVIHKHIILKNTPQQFKTNQFSAHTCFFCLVAALQYFGRRHLTDKIANCAGEFGASVLFRDGVFQPGATYGLVLHGPLVRGTAVSGCTALQKNCTGFVHCVPRGIGGQDRLLSDGV